MIFPIAAARCKTLSEVQIDLCRSAAQIFTARVHVVRLVYHHVDVFSAVPFGGSSLAVFHDAGGLSPDQMLTITREMKHFESIFLERSEPINNVRARVFDLFEELPFAGHPLIGAAAVLHRLDGNPLGQQWSIALEQRSVTVQTEKTAQGYLGWLDQGPATILGSTPDPETVAQAFGLSESALCHELPLEVISTGLRYLVVPVRSNVLEQARISSDITSMLRSIGAQFVVLFDEHRLEIRHWNNDGLLEDVGTGSAAGVIGAYRLRHSLVKSDEPFTLHQGRFMDRPSSLHVVAKGHHGQVQNVKVGGEVAFVGQGIIESLP